MDWLWRRLHRERDLRTGTAEAGNGEAAQQAKQRAQKRFDDTLAVQPRVEAVVRRLQQPDTFGRDLDTSFRPRRAAT